MSQWRILWGASDHLQLTRTLLLQQLQATRNYFAWSKPARSFFRGPLPYLFYLIIHCQFALAKGSPEKTPHDASICVGISFLGDNPLYSLPKGGACDEEVGGIAESHSNPSRSFWDGAVLLENLNITEGFFHNLNPWLELLIALLLQQVRFGIFEGFSGSI